MKKMILTCAFYFATTLSAFAQSADYDLGYKLLKQLVGPQADSIGDRYAGSEKEKLTADWITKAWKEQGYQVTKQDFAFEFKQRTLSSQNLMIDLPGKFDKVLVVGAHYDSTGKQSEGATDNGAGLVTMLALSKLLKDEKQLSYGIRFIAFGAEEVGKKGSLHYVQTLSDNDTKRIQGMLNLDTVAGGDFLYIHSAHSTPYKCPQGANYAFQTELRDSLLKFASITATGQFNLHPGYSSYAPGEAGDWSDHMPFACAGIPVAQIEATNFKINGEDGFDGYSQSIHPNLWDCFDKSKMTACNRDKEKQWGKIWHTQYDRLALLNEFFPGRVQQQLNQVLKLLHTYVLREQTSNQ